MEHHPFHPHDNNPLGTATDPVFTDCMVCGEPIDYTCPFPGQAVHGQQANFIGVKHHWCSLPDMDWLGRPTRLDRLKRLLGFK